MQVEFIFSCWITLESGAVKRLELPAASQDHAIQRAFERHPRAVACSCRPARDEPLRTGDALSLLDARRCA